MHRCGLILFTSSVASIPEFAHYSFHGSVRCGTLGGREILMPQSYSCQCWTA